MEKRIEEFWKMFDNNQFIKSTDSITDEVIEYPPIEYMGEIVKINGEFDKTEIDNWLKNNLTIH